MTRAWTRLLLFSLGGAHDPSYPWHGGVAAEAGIWMGRLERGRTLLWGSDWRDGYWMLWGGFGNYELREEASKAGRSISRAQGRQSVSCRSRQYRPCGLNIDRPWRKWGEKKTEAVL